MILANRAEKKKKNVMIDLDIDNNTTEKRQNEKEVVANTG